MLKESLQGDFKAAMKAKDAFALGVIRMVMAAIQSKEIEKRGKPRVTTSVTGDGIENAEVVTQGKGLPADLSDGEILEVLAKEHKKRLDAVALFVAGGREDLAETERTEAAFIAKYLPAQLSREEIAKAVDAVIAGAASKDFGMIMKEAMAALKGRADGKTVGEIIKERI